MSSSRWTRSFQTDTTSTLSALERLPKYILEDIFLSACNCNLPLVSSTLLAALPPTPPLIQKIGLSMLSSNDRTIQSELLQRRFLNLELYDALAAKLNSPDGSQFRFAFDVQLCPRLVRDLATPSQQRSATAGAGRYWKIELLRRLKKAGIDAQGEVLASKVDGEWMLDAAYSGLEEAVQDGNVDAVDFFVGGRDDGLLIAPNIKCLETAFVKQECANKEIVYLLINCTDEYYYYDFWESEAIDEWIAEKKAVDARRRENGGGDEGTGVWVGEWAELLWTEREGMSYEDFVSLQRVDISGGDGLKADGRGSDEVRGDGLKADGRGSDEVRGDGLRGDGSEADGSDID